MLNRVSHFKWLFMLIILTGLIMSANLTAYSAQNTIYLAKDLLIQPIEDGVYVVTHNFPWPANALLVKISAEDFVLVDTPYTPEATSTLVNWLKSKYKQCRLVVINTGYHIDNLGGNEYLLQQGIPVYGSDLTARLIDDKGEKTRAELMNMLTAPADKYYYDAYKKLVFKKPDHLFKINEGLKLQVGNETIQVYYPGPSHAPDNVVVYFTNRKILFGGCMVKSGESQNLGFTGDANPDEWYKSVEKVAAKFPQSRFVIPGHGNLGDISLLKHTLKLLEAAL